MVMASTTMNISIPEELKVEALKQVKRNHYSTTSDYIQALIRRDISSAAERERFDRFILQGIESGEPVEMTLDDLRKRLSARVKK